MKEEAVWAGSEEESGKERTTEGVCRDKQQGCQRRSSLNEAMVTKLRL